ncbi:glycosyltransferase family 4 protein [Tunicatimonas pelagia]|uniref:glycosyltransferase family 4 protein n=1 Tax=Tunicatimonas pelagia TaxID=931531 RepID=UPI0026670005|nr:glycosyltransferase family 4 protein [Tunicatimonas pelagia]WKN41948.1 glycosyltransferase family 4 protein [Tunicatimonas pelagia]
MRILELCLASSLGGLELYFHRCCQHFTSSGHLSLAVVAPETRLASLMKQDGIQHTTLPPGRWYNVIGRAITLASIIKEQQIDILHVHHKADLLVVALSKRLTSYSFSVVHTRQMTLHHTKKDLYHRFLYSSIDLFIAITNQVQQQLRQNIAVDPRRVVRLYYGVSAPPQSSPSTNDPKPSQTQIGVFSRIDRMKGQHVIVEALHHLRQRGITPSTYFYGDTMDESYVTRLKESIQEYSLESQIHFMGFHPNATSLMPQMDIIVMPSLNETFGLTLIEAMLGEVAVVGTNYGGIPEIIDDDENGLLFERENSRQLADCLQKLVDDPSLRTRLAQAGREKAKEQFQASDHFARLTQLMNNVSTA